MVAKYVSNCCLKADNHQGANVHVLKNIPLGESSLPDKIRIQKVTSQGKLEINSI